MSNGYRGDAERAMAALDAFVAALVSSQIAEPKDSRAVDQEPSRASRSSS